LNVIGFTCYTLYVCALYYSPTIQNLYHDKYGPDSQISVQSNDVAFAVHALLLTIATLAQITYYDGSLWSSRQPQGTSRLISYIIVVLLCVMLFTPAVVISSGSWHRWTFTWLDYFYLLSFVKIVVTMIKYIPQVVLNYQRKSTLGWSKFMRACVRIADTSDLLTLLRSITPPCLGIWQILLDFSGGILSDLQLVGDCYVLGDWSGITGNLAKLLLGLVSILFDYIFMLQHYVWYNSETTNLELVADAGHDDIVGLLL
jgi:cystinosin